MGKNINKRNIAIQASILATATIIVKVIGFVYRIPMQNILKDEGMGYYSNAFTLYRVLVVISSVSIPTAVSRMVSVEIAKKQYRNVQRIFKATLTYALLSGVMASLILLIASKAYVEFIGMDKALYAVRVLAPTIIIVALLGVFRGYFQGMNTMMPTALSQVVEQILNAIASVVAAQLLLLKGIEYGAAGGTLGTGIGALSGLVFMILVYYGIVRNQINKKVELYSKYLIKKKPYRIIIKQFFFTSTPILLGTLVIQITDFIDTIMFNRGLIHHGYSKTNIAILNGIMDAKYRVFITLFVSLSAALATAAIPNITGAVIRKNKSEIENKVNVVYRFMTIVVIPSCIGLIIFAKPLLVCLFNEKNMMPVYLLQCGSVSIILFGLVTISVAVLQALNYINIPAKNAIISSVVKILLNIFIFFLLDIGIFGMIITTIAFAMCSVYLNLGAVLKRTKVKLDINKIFIIPLKSAIIMGISSGLLYKLINLLTKNIAISLFISVIVAIVVYAVSIVKFKGLDEQELTMLPFGKKLVVIFYKVGLL